MQSAETVLGVLRERVDKQLAEHAKLPIRPADRLLQRPRRALERQQLIHLGGAKLPDRLHFALIRVSGCNPNAPGAAELFAQWPPSSELRGNPVAKRALWPILRRLRRGMSP